MSGYIAVMTYGKEPKQDGDEKVSAIKLGGGDLLILAWLQREFGARDVGGTRSSYTYLYLPQEPILSGNWLVLEVTDTQLSDLKEQYRTARADVWSRVYEYREDGEWWTMPVRGVEPKTAKEVGVRLTLKPAAVAVAAEQVKSDGAIYIKASQADDGKATWYWVEGDTYEHRHALKEAGGRWSKKRQSWYFIGRLPDQIAALANGASVPVSPTGENPRAPLQPTPTPTSPEEPKPKKLLPQTFKPGAEVLTTAQIGEDIPVKARGRVLAYIGGEYEVQFGEQKVKLDPKYIVAAPIGLRIREAPDAALQIAQRFKEVPLVFPSEEPLLFPQPYVGNLGNNVYCYGYAVDEKALAYINVAGPRMAVEAVRGKASSNATLSLASDDSPPLELFPSEKKYDAYSAYEQDVRLQSLILIAKPDKAHYFFLLTPHHGLKQLVMTLRTVLNYAVFDHWAPFLWRIGHEAQLLSQLAGQGATVMKVVASDQWLDLILAGIKLGIIDLEEAAHGAANQ
ncbi:MAG: hypothetical protein OHK0046_47710 [Anaerolineae bacterium]